MVPLKKTRSLPASRPQPVVALPSLREVDQHRELVALLSKVESHLDVLATAVAASLGVIATALVQRPGTLPPTIAAMPVEDVSGEDQLAPSDDDKNDDDDDPSYDPSALVESLDAGADAE
jgi:hypothetical protein